MYSDRNLNLLVFGILKGWSPCSRSFPSWKSPVCVTPEAQVPLTLESKFRMTPIKS